MRLIQVAAPATVHPRSLQRKADLEAGVAGVGVQVRVAVW